MPQVKRHLLLSLIKHCALMATLFCTIFFANLRMNQLPFAFKSFLAPFMVGNIIGFIIWNSKRKILRINQELSLKVQEQSQTNAQLTEEIDRRERYEAELSEAKDAAESANRAKSAFLANMSHELRTPLNAIIGYTEILEEDLEDCGDPDQLQDLVKIRIAGTELLSLIESVLQLANIETGATSLHIEEFSLAPLLERLAQENRPKLQKNNNTFTLEVTQAPGQMHSDPDKLLQILSRLLDNATKFTQNGSISLQVERTSSPSPSNPLSSDDTEEGEWLSFSVQDTGIGFDDEEHEALFAPFVQADASTTRKYQGSGLGLSISRHYARLLGGDIYVESTPGEGATFRLQLPSTLTRKNP